MNITVNCLPATSRKLTEYINAQRTDVVCSKVCSFVQQGWPDKHKIEPSLKLYWKERENFTVTKDNLLLYGNRIVVPACLQKETLRRIHEGYQGIQRCQLRARCSVWWPGIMSQMKDYIEHCLVCVRNQPPRYEPMISTPLPEYPWQKVASDLFHLKGSDYLIIVDYFSRFPEIIKLHSTNSATVIEALKTIFARHGIPQTLVTDNGPQYTADEFAKFARTYNFFHLTSSPYFPQSNGLAERAVQTVKNILRDSRDTYLSLLIYRTTPLPWCNLSPAELLMGRKLRSNLPQLPEQFVPTWSYLVEFCEQDAEFKRKQKSNFDKRHKTKSLPLIPESSEVWITSNRSNPIRGRVARQVETPRSYELNMVGEFGVIGITSTLFPRVVMDHQMVLLLNSLSFNQIQASAALLNLLQLAQHNSLPPELD